MSCFFCDGAGRVCLYCGAAVHDELEGCPSCEKLPKEYAKCDACNGTGEKEDGDGKRG